MTIPRDKHGFINYVIRAKSDDLRELTFKIDLQKELITIFNTSLPQLTAFDHPQTFIEKTISVLNLNTLEERQLKPLVAYLKNTTYGYSVFKLLLQNAIFNSSDQKLIDFLHRTCQEFKKEGNSFEEPIGNNIYGIEPSFTPITFALLTKNLNLVELLIHYGADINAEDSNGFTPLLLACQTNKWALVELLIEKGANPNVPDKTKPSPLRYARQANNQKIVNLLIKIGAKRSEKDCEDFAALHNALKALDRNKFNYLLSNGSSIYDRNLYGYSCLHTAILDDSIKTDTQIKIIKLLLEKGVNINDPSDDGFTALYLAMYKNSSISNFLLKSGADLNSVDEKGESLFQKACKLNHQNVIEKLIYGGAVSDQITEALRKKVFAMKLLAHIWGIGGQFQMNLPDGTPFKLELTGMDFRISFKVMQAMALKFLKEQKIENDVREQISNTINKAYIDIEDIEQIIYLINNKNPQIVLGGSMTHAVGFIFYDGKMVICNRGFGTQDVQNRPDYCKAYVVYYCPKEAEKMAMLSQLTSRKLTNEELENTLINLTKDLREISYLDFKLKKSKLATCTWASSKTIFLAILTIALENKERAYSIYKQFTLYSRKRSLEEFTSKYDDPFFLKPFYDKAKLKKIDFIPK